MTKTNSHGGLDHLIITKSEKADLIQRIKENFGDKLNQANQNYIVSAASMLKFYPFEKKGYKCSDEPSELTASHMADYAAGPKKAGPISANLRMPSS